MAEYDVVLLPSFTQVEHWRKEHCANRSAGLFAQTVSTFSAWVADLWELHGDGRLLVGSVERLVFMSHAFSGLDMADAGDELTISSGVIKLAARCVSQACGLPAFERALEAVREGKACKGLSSRESTLLRGIVRYRSLLQSAGFVEPGEAAAFVAEHASSVFPRQIKVLCANAAPLDWICAHFFAACNKLETHVMLDVRQAKGAEGIGLLPDDIDVRFAFPAGRYAQSALVVDEVRDLLSSAAANLRLGASLDLSPVVVVTCKDPLSLFDQVEEELAAIGAIVRVQAKVPFALTDFGKRFMALGRVVAEDNWSSDDLSDAVQPPFSGFGRLEALGIDSGLRQDRLVEREACLEKLRSISDTFSQMEEMVGDAQADILMGVFEQLAFSDATHDDVWRSLQLAAMSAVRAATSAARHIEAAMSSCLFALERVQVSVSCESRLKRGANMAHAERCPKVVITTQQAAAQMGAYGCDALVLCDLTSDDYPMTDKDDALCTLFAKLGMQYFDTAIARARRTFKALQDLPSMRMVCMRPLNDWDGAPTDSAAVLQEFIDAHAHVGEAALEQEDRDETTGLPASLAGQARHRGEELLFANAAARPEGTLQPIEGETPVCSAGHVSDDKRSWVALPRRSGVDRVSLGFAPSPSQVETYLECPYKWFVQKRVKTEMLDEGFGPLERGSYSHKVLQEFYRAFMDLGMPKVNLENIERAQSLLSEIAETVAQAQRLMEPGSGRYVPINHMELRQMEACKRQLVDYLQFEARLLPGYHPAHLEYSITPEDGIRYANRPFVGTVDRIDVDDEGNAVVIDYKGSLGASYEIAGKSPANLGKVQTRMYARAVERKLGLRVVGALYVSYGNHVGCSGAYDGRLLEAAHLPNMKHARCACVSSDVEAGEAVQDFSQLAFDAMLDATEQLVAQAEDAMQAGSVQPAPTASDVCEYCPARNCPKRGA